MRVVGQFLMRFWVAALALSILLPVLSLIDAVKLARKTWGWWQPTPNIPELLRPPKKIPRGEVASITLPRTPVHKG